jgi:hypothetical protein
MWKWLRSWFAWRFSLRRLVVATVFLGAFVGLNVQEIGPMRPRKREGAIVPGASVCFRGWPLPFSCQQLGFELGWVDAAAAAETYRIPWTHQTYCMLAVESCNRDGEFLLNYPNNKLLLGSTDLFAAIIPLCLILFLQIPRRKESSPPPSARAGG